MVLYPMKEEWFEMKHNQSQENIIKFITQAIAFREGELFTSLVVDVIDSKSSLAHLFTNDLSFERMFIIANKAYLNNIKDSFSYQNIYTTSQYRSLIDKQSKVLFLKYNYKSQNKLSDGNRTRKNFGMSSSFNINSLPYLLDDLKKLMQSTTINLVPEDITEETLMQFSRIAKNPVEVAARPRQFHKKITNFLNS